MARPRVKVLARDGSTCQVCGAPAENVDHILPAADGGLGHPGTTRALCARCNLRR